MRCFHYKGIYCSWDITGPWLVDQGQIDRADIMRPGQFTKLRDIPVGIDVGGRCWKQEESRHGGKRTRGVKGEARWEVRSKNGKQASFVATATWIYGAPLSGLWTLLVPSWLCATTSVHQAIKVSFRSRISPSSLFLFYGAFPHPRG